MHALKTIPVLDHGFVRYVDHMGTDQDIVMAARTSTGGALKSPEEDERLLRYMMRKRHTSPFEMAEVKVIIQCPVFVWRQWIRHRTANVNEHSMRYTEAVNDMHKPNAWRSQSEQNKQGSSEEIIPTHEVVQLKRIQQRMQDEARFEYERRLSLGVAREQARNDLPLSTYTKSVWKCDLHNIFHLLGLRLDEHAQYETRQFAEALACIVKELFPVSYQAFKDYRLNAVTLSALEIKIFKGNMHPEQVLSGSELKEFKEKCVKLGFSS